MMSGVTGSDSCFNTLFKAGAEVDSINATMMLPKNQYTTHDSRGKITDG